MRGLCPLCSSRFGQDPHATAVVGESAPTTTCAGVLSAILLDVNTSKSVSNTDRYGCAFPIPVRSIRFRTGMQTLSLTGSKPSKRSAHGESCSRRAVHRVCWSRTCRLKEMVSFNESMAIHDDPHKTHFCL